MTEIVYRRAVTTTPIRAFDEVVPVGTVFRAGPLDGDWAVCEGLHFINIMRGEFDYADEPAPVRLYGSRESVGFHEICQLVRSLRLGRNAAEADYEPCAFSAGTPGDDDRWAGTEFYDC